MGEPSNRSIVCCGPLVGLIVGDDVVFVLVVVSSSNVVVGTQGSVGMVIASPVPPATAVVTHWLAGGA